MVSSVCRGSYPSMTPHASPTRKQHIDPQKDYFSPLQVETSVEYDLPAHIYPPKGSQPILMIHPGYVSAVRARSRAVVTPSPTAMVATSGAARPLAPLQLPQTQQVVAAAKPPRTAPQRSWCTCGNLNCTSISVKSSNVQSVSRNVQNIPSQSVSKSVPGQSVTRNMVTQSVPRVVQGQSAVVRNMQNQVAAPRSVQSGRILHSGREASVPPNLLATTRSSGFIVQNSQHLHQQTQLQQQQTQLQQQQQTQLQQQQQTQLQQQQQTQLQQQQQTQLQQQQQTQLQQQQQTQLQQQQQTQLQQQQQTQLQQQQTQLQQQQEQLQQQQQQQLQQQQSLPQQQAQMPWGGGGGGRCNGPCCNPKAAAIAPPQAEFVAPGLPPSLLARTPTRGTAGGSPKLRAARTRRGLSVASSVNLPDYLGTSRPARLTGGAVHVHPRPRALSTSMGALAATPAPPMAHQHMGMGASLTTSLDLARTDPLTPRSLLSVQQQQQPPQGSTASLLYTVGLSRDSGCSVGAETAGGEWASDRTRGLVDSGFCTPVDLTDDFVSDTFTMNGGSWKESSTPLPSIITTNTTSSTGVHTTSSSSSIMQGPTHSSLIPGAAHAHHYLPQPLWNLAY